MARENSSLGPSERMELLSIILSKIPSHRERAVAKTLEEISDEIFREVKMEEDTVYGLTISVISFLDLLGVLEYREEELLQTKNQIATYFVNSLEWYFKNNQRLLSNWERSGTSKEINASNLFDMAASFLKMMELRRVELSNSQSLELGFSRVQGVSINIIKTSYKKNAYILHKWDNKACQYQMIGGRIRLTEEHLQAAKRELREEITEHDLIEESDFTITTLNRDPIEYIAMSRTYGTVTKYTVWLHHVIMKMEKLELSPDDKWVSMEEMRKGSTREGRQILNPKFLSNYEANIGSLSDLSDSISMKKATRWFEFVEIQVPVFGIFNVNMPLPGLVWVATISCGLGFT